MCFAMDNEWGRRLDGSAATLVASTTKDASAVTRSMTIVEERGRERKEGEVKNVR
jgi:hypothetical protein